MNLCIGFALRCGDPKPNPSGGIETPSRMRDVRMPVDVELCRRHRTSSYGFSCSLTLVKLRRYSI